MKNDNNGSLQSIDLAQELQELSQMQTDENNNNSKDISKNSETSDLRESVKDQVETPETSIRTNTCLDSVGYSLEDSKYQNIRVRDIIFLNFKDFLRKIYLKEADPVTEFLKIVDQKLKDDTLIENEKLKPLLEKEIEQNLEKADEINMQVHSLLQDEGNESVETIKVKKKIL